MRELAERIESYIAEHNLDLKRYVWKAAGHQILEKITVQKTSWSKEQVADSCESLFMMHGTRCVPEMRSLYYLFIDYRKCSATC